MTLNVNHLREIGWEGGQRFVARIQSVRNGNNHFIVKIFFYKNIY